MCQSNMLLKHTLLDKVQTPLRLGSVLNDAALVGVTEASQ